MAVQRVTESGAFQTAAPRVDRKQGLIRGVRWLGEDSVNGRHYGAQYRASTVARYEGARVNKDHPKGNDLERGFDEWVGTLENVEARSDANYGDLRIRKGHRDFEAIMDAAENHWRHFGLSPVHSVDWKQRGKIKEAVALDEVFSIDIVTEPATNKNLYESRNRMASPTTRKLAAIVAAAPESTPGRSILKEAVAQYGELDVTVDPEAGHDAHVTAAFDAAVNSITAESIDPAAKRKKLAELCGSAAKESTDDGSADDTAARLAAMEKRAVLADCKNLLLESGREATDVRVRALAAVAEADRKPLCESFPPKAGAAATRESRRPFSSVPAFNGDGEPGGEKDGSALLKEHLERTGKLATERVKRMREAGRI